MTANLLVHITALLFVLFTGHSKRIHTASLLPPDQEQLRPARTVSSTACRLSSSSSRPFALHATTKSPRRRHVIDGMDYHEIKLQLPVIGTTVTLLEATLETQNKLIDLALLLLDEEEEEESMNATSDRSETSSSSSLSSSSIVKVEDVYGAVLWPAALTVASYLLQHASTLLTDQIVVEAGTGTGLVALAAAVGGAQHVVATDYEPVPLAIVQAAATLNRVDRLSTRRLDICDVTTSSAALPLDMTVFVAADVLYEPKTGRALAQRALQALQRGAHVIVGDSPGRPGRPAFVATLESFGIVDAVFHEYTGWSVTGDRHELICGTTSTTRSDTERELVVAVMHLDPSNYMHLRIE